MTEDGADGGSGVDAKAPGWKRQLRVKYLRVKIHAFEKLGNDAGLIATFEELAGLEPADEDHLRTLLGLYTKTGDQPQVVRCLERLVSVFPSEHGPLRRLAEIHFHAGEHARAHPLYVRLYERTPEDPHIANTLGEIHLKLNDPVQARACFLQLVARTRDRNALRWLFKVGQLFLIHQQHEEALRTYRGILDAVPDEPTAQLALSKLVYQGGDLDEAARIFRHLPEEGGIGGLADKLRRAMRLREAALKELILEGRGATPPPQVAIDGPDGSLLVKVPDSFPKTVKASYTADELRGLRRDVIRTYLREGCHDRALTNLTQFSTDDPAEKSWASAQRGLALARRGDLILAATELDRVELTLLTGRIGGDLDLIYQIGQTYLQCNRLLRALEAFTRVLVLDAAYKDVEALVARLRVATSGSNLRGDLAPSAEKSAPGSARRMGPYELGELFHTGWMGELYRAVDPALGRKIVLRHMPPEMMKDKDLRERFRVAARGAIGLAHAHLVAPLDLVEPVGELWIATEQVPGAPADAAVSAGPLPPALVSDLGAQAAAGVAAAHARKILHRDLKSSDFLIDLSMRTLRVLDFGLAGVANTLEVAPSEYLDRRSHYMPPEFILGERVDEKGDVYSLGALLYLLACGRHPFPDGELHARLFSYLERPMPRPRTLVPSLPEALEETILACLARDRATRPTAAALAARLVAQK